MEQDLRGAQEAAGIALCTLGLSFEKEQREKQQQIEVEQKDKEQEFQETEAQKQREMAIKQNTYEILLAVINSNRPFDEVERLVKLLKE